MDFDQLIARASRGAVALVRTGGFFAALAMASGPATSASAARGGKSSAGADLRSEKFRTGAQPFVEIDNLYGAVDVEAGPEGEVLVEARISGARDGAGDSFRVEIAPTPAGVRARASCAGAGARFAWCGRQRVDFVVHVPANASLSLSGVGTDLHVSGVRGDLALSTVSGSIDVSDAGLVRAESASGSVRVERATAAEISAGDGNVELVGMRKGTAIYRRESGVASDGEPVPDANADEDSSGESIELAQAHAQRSIVIRGAETVLRALLGAFHRSPLRSCGDGEEC